MAYIPSGTIKAYMGIKSIVKECFFDKNKRPYVEVSKLNNTVSVLIYREEGKPIVHSIRISDIEYLKQVYDQLYQMAFRRGNKMSLIIKGMSLPKHSATSGEKDTAYRCIILAHPDNSVELVIDTEFTSAYDNGHNIQRYPLAEIPKPHGRLIDADELTRCIEHAYGDRDIVKLVTNNIARQQTIVEAEVSE